MYVLIEAKSSREHVGHAIDQLFDYLRLMDQRLNPVTLFLHPLTKELGALSGGPEVAAIWESGDSFVVSVGGKLTVRS